MDKLRAMQTFVAIIDRGSLTAAADAMGSSLPAVVRTLAALESPLGVRLLNRTTRRLASTEAGLLCLERTRRLLCLLHVAGAVMLPHIRALVVAPFEHDELAGPPTVRLPSPWRLPELCP